jgi:hypothetical protein
MPTIGKNKGKLLSKTQYKFSGWQLLEYLEAQHCAADKDKLERSR